MERKKVVIENPFALKVGQVFTGFGIGCGVGIGVGRPLNLGAIPILQQVTGAARGATDAFSGVGRHANSFLRRLGAKNIEVGIGCGVGFGHGFGVGLAVKPGVVHHLQSCLGQALAKLILKFGTVPGLSVGQGMIPESLKNTMSLVNENELQNPLGNVMQLALSTTEQTSQGQARNARSVMGSTYMQFSPKGSLQESSLGSHTEKVVSSFLQNPVLKDEGDVELNTTVGRLREENDVLQMVLKHQKVIDALMEENEKFREILVQELKVAPSKLQACNKSRLRSANPCSDCFECRRRRRKLG